MYNKSCSGIIDNEQKQILNITHKEDLGITILKNMASHLDYTRKEDRNYINISL